MSALAVVFMVVCVSSVVVLTGWCYYKVLTSKPPAGDEPAD